MLIGPTRPLRQRRRMPWAAGFNPNILPLYSGLVANTRGYQNRVAIATTAQACTRSRHIATEDITSLQLMYTGWCVISGVETGSGGNCTVRASVEYPVGSLAVPGTRTQVLFSGLATGTEGSSGRVLSDPLSIAIPKGATFYVWSHKTQAAGFLCYGTGTHDTGNGEGTQKAVSGLADTTLAGTITPNDSAMWVGPGQIIGPTRKRSVLLFGDSRAQGGSGDSYSDGVGALGEVARSFQAMGIACANWGSSGADAADFVADHSREMAAGFVAGVSDIYWQHGQNDFNAGATTATMQSRAAAFKGYADAAGKRTNLGTIAPQTTGAWTLADRSDQTTHSSFANREAYNDWLRAGSGPAGALVHDTAAAQEFPDSGKWLADGTPQKYTVDGIHATQFALQQVVAQQRILPSKFI